MTVDRKTKLRLGGLLAALIAAGALVPLAYHRNNGPSGTTVATAPARAPAAVPSEPEETPPPPAPPGAETVPAEEAESDHENPLSPSAPRTSIGHEQGLHSTPDPLRLSAGAALLVDQDSGDVLVHKNDQAVLPIASLTKLMTTLLVVEAKQPMDEVLTITQDDVDTLRHSRSRLKPGTQLTRQEALHLALMSSENRAAHALARYYPGGLPKMVEAMNAKAKQLGMKNTTYVDPTGLSNENRSTVRDLALLARAAVQNPLMREFSTDASHLANLNGRTLQYVNSNRLVRNHRAGWDIELQKTGYIIEAGRCLTMVAKVAGHNLLMVLLDADSNGTRLNDAERLRHYALQQWNVPDPAIAEAKAARAARVAKAEKTPAHRESTADAKPSRGKHKTEVAEKEATDKRAERRTAVAKAPDGAEKPTHGKATRVRQTFVAAHEGHKS